MPLPAPCKSANAMTQGAPNRTRYAAPSGCSAETSRAKETGWNDRNTPNSTMRAPTWAGPTSAAAAIAEGADAPAACSKPGRCAAIAPCTNQVAEKKRPISALLRAAALPSAIHSRLVAGWAKCRDAVSSANSTERRAGHLVPPRPGRRRASPIRARGKRSTVNQ